MVAILMALGWVYEIRPDKVMICSDSMAVLMSLQSMQTNRSDILIEIMITLYSIKQIGIITRFIWVPAHVGIQGNEEADKMAKDTLNMDEPSFNILISRSEGKHLILEACNRKWQTFQDSCQTGQHFHKVQKSIKKYKIIHNISRREQVILTHLRTGHLNLNHTLHNTGLCEVCLIVETVEHVMMVCNVYEREKKKS